MRPFIHPRPRVPRGENTDAGIVKFVASPSRRRIRPLHDLDPTYANSVFPGS